ncbi:MAG TPA: cation diffusion facilitator family transporter [Thermoplasmatales archaeon]|nr:cation diffusion facilitator family transporter [Thermoplasmatales archaeon]
MISEKQSLFREGQKISLLAGIATLFLALLKLIVGYFSNSLLLISDAIHSASDLLVIFTASIGIKIASKPPDERFPYGYYKAENLATLFISFLIFFAGYEIAMEGYKKLYVMPSLRIPFIAVLTAIVSIVVSYTIAIHICKVGKKWKMNSLIVIGHERKIDAISSIFVLAGIVLNFYDIKYVEGVFSIGISILIFRVSIESMRDAIYALMDFSPKYAKERIRDVLKKEGDIEGFYDLKLRKSGPFLFGEVKILIKRRFDVIKAHEIAEKIEEKVKKEVREVDFFPIHIAPFEGRYAKVAVPVDGNKISNHFGRADKFLIFSVDREERKVIEKREIENPYKEKKMRVGLLCAKFLISEGVNALVTKEIGEIAYHMLGDKGVEIYVGVDDVEESINKFIKEDMKKLEEPTKVKE